MFFPAIRVWYCHEHEFFLICGSNRFFSFLVSCFALRGECWRLCNLSSSFSDGRFAMFHMKTHNFHTKNYFRFHSFSSGNFNQFHAVCRLAIHSLFYGFFDSLRLRALTLLHEHYIEIKWDSIECRKRQHTHTFTFAKKKLKGTEKKERRIILCVAFSFYVLWRLMVDSTASRERVRGREVFTNHWRPMKNRFDSQKHSSQTQDRLYGNKQFARSCPSVSLLLRTK